jgi:hypothetical protein
MGNVYQVKKGVVLNVPKTESAARFLWETFGKILIHFLLLIDIIALLSLSLSLSLSKVVLHILVKILVAFGNSQPI